MPAGGGVEIDDMPRLLDVAEACASHPAFADAHPDRVKPA